MFAASAAIIHSGTSGRMNLCETSCQQTTGRRHGMISGARAIVWYMPATMRVREHDDVTASHLHRAVDGGRLAASLRRMRPPYAPRRVPGDDVGGRVGGPVGRDDDLVAVGGIVDGERVLEFRGDRRGFVVRG